VEVFKGDPSGQDFDEWCEKLRRIWRDIIRRRRNSVVVIAAEDISCHDAATTLMKARQSGFPYSHAFDNLENAFLHLLSCQRCRPIISRILEGEPEVSS
jgi:hypothetical protein